jgi:hypothetical protein
MLTYGRLELINTIICLIIAIVIFNPEKFHIPLENASSFFHKTHLEGNSRTCSLGHRLQQQCSQTSHQATQLGALEKEI